MEVHNLRIDRLEVCPIVIYVRLSLTYRLDIPIVARINMSVIDLVAG